MCDRTRTANHLNTKDRIFIDLRCGSQLGNYLRPVGVHLISEDHRERSLNPLAKFETIDLNHNFSVRPDVHERIGRINLRRRRLVCCLR